MGFWGWFGGEGLEVVWATVKLGCDLGFLVGTLM